MNTPITKKQAILLKVMYDCSDIARYKLMKPSHLVQGVGVWDIGDDDIDLLSKVYSSECIEENKEVLRLRKLRDAFNDWLEVNKLIYSDLVKTTEYYFRG